MRKWKRCGVKMVRTFQSEFQDQCALNGLSSERLI